MADAPLTTAPADVAKDTLGVRRSSPFQEIGSSGLRRYSGYVTEEFLKVLQGRRAAEVFREMRENDAVVNAMLFAIEYLARNVKWRVDPASQDNEDLQCMAFVQTCLNDMSHTWNDTIAEILSMLPYGWAWHEIVYKRRLGPSEDGSRRSQYTDGYIGWRKIALRSQDSLLRWTFDDEGGVKEMIQWAPPMYQMVPIPVEKSLLFKTTSFKNNPEGRSILRGGYRSWYFLKRLQEYEAIGIERDLAGYPVIQPRLDINSNIMGPDLWNPNDPDAARTLSGLETFVKSVRRDEQDGAILPGWLDFKLLSTGSRRQYDTDAIITRYEQRIAMTTLADFILIGHETTGSFALSTNKSKLFGLALSSFLDTIAEVFNRHAIPRLLALNGWVGRPMPRIAHGQVDTPDLGALGMYVQQLSGAGIMFSDPEVEAALMAAAKLPTRDAREVAKGNGYAKRWRYDPYRQEFLEAIQELRANLVTKFITHEDGKWLVSSNSGKVLGTHETEEEAKHHLAMIEAHKGAGNGSHRREAE